jgi:hypothetical protein
MVFIGARIECQLGIFVLAVVSTCTCYVQVEGFTGRANPTTPLTLTLLNRSLYRGTNSKKRLGNFESIPKIPKIPEMTII